MPTNPSAARANATTVAALATLSTQFEALANRVGEVASDAKEARDGVLNIQATLKEQRFGERLQALSDHVEKLNADLRHDLVHAITKAREELGGRVDDHERRIDELEAEVDRRDGLAKVLDWLLSHGLSAIIGGVGAVIAFLGLKGFHH